MRSPKLLLRDTGLISILQGPNANRLVASAPVLVGPLLENFVAMELRKQWVWSATQPRLFHFRTRTGQEADVVLEDSTSRIVGVEVKASATVGARDFKGLRTLSEASGDRYRRGVVLYTGRTPVPLGESLYAPQVSSLWELNI